MTDAPAASRSRGSARTSTRSSPRSRRSGGSGRARRCCSSLQAVAVAARRAPGLPARPQAPRPSGRRSAFALAYLLFPPTQWLIAERVPPGRARDPAPARRLVFLDEDRLCRSRSSRGGAARRRSTSGSSSPGSGSGTRSTGASCERASSSPPSPVAIAVVAALVVVPPSRPQARRSRAATTTRPSTPATLGYIFAPAAPARARCRSPRRSRCLPRRPGAPAQPALVDADADLDPLPLRRDDHPGSARRDRVRGSTTRRPDRLRRTRRRARRHRRARSARPGRDEGRRTRAALRRARSGRARRRGRERHELARGAPLRRASASSASRVLGDADVGRGRHDAADVPGQPRPDRSRRPLAASGATGWRVVFEEDGVIVFRKRLERDRLRQQVGAEGEREQLRAAVVLGRRERHGPDRVPRRQPRGGREQQAAGEPEPDPAPRAPPARARRARPRAQPRRARARAPCGTPSCSSRCGSA